MLSSAKESGKFVKIVSKNTTCKWGKKNNENSQKKENSFVWQPKPEDSGSNCHASGPGPDVREVGQPVILIINIHLELLVPGI